jgi:hypothetical protein
MGVTYEICEVKQQNINLLDLKKNQNHEKTMLFTILCQLQLKHKKKV